MNSHPVGKVSLPYPLIVALLGLTAVWGCTIQLVSNYDERTDQAVTALQKKIETFFVTVDSQVGLPECTYERHVSFYQDVKVDISAIQMRVNAIPQNEITSEQVGLLESSLDNLESLHKLGCLSGNQVENLQSSFNSLLTAILKLELAKKRGE